MSPSVPPPRRRYDERQHSKDTRTMDERARPWLPAAFVLAIGGGGFVLYLFAIVPGRMLPLFVGVGVIFAIISFVVQSMSGRAAQLFGDAAYGGAGSSIPYKESFSQAESLAAAGQYEQAIAAYERVLETRPAEADPYLRIARIYRKELEQLDDAAYWYRKVRREAQLPPGKDLAVSRELIELYMASEDRARAIPELARIIDKFSDTPEREWAEGLLAELKNVEY